MSNNSQSLILFRPNRRYPMLLAAAGLFYIYVMQFPLNYFFFNAGAGNYYHLGDWFIAYGFVLISSLVFLLFMYVGMMGGAVHIKQTFDWQRKSDKRISLPIVFVIFGLFFLWSYAMFVLNIGMTIYADFDPLPYRITGILFYGRITLQPLLVSIIAYQYANSNRKWIIFLLIISLGAWVCVASGSRFISILFALPLLLLLTGKWKYLIFGFVLTAFITIASMTRAFVLPFVLDWQVAGDYIQMYANEETQTEMLENILMVPLSYVIIRPMGMAEVLSTLSYGEITSNFYDAFISFASYFLYFLNQDNIVSTRNVMGIDDDYLGGFSRDMFSNYWIFSGGSLLLYAISISLIGFMLGKSYRFFAIAFERFGYAKGGIMAFAGLFLFAMDVRGSHLSMLLLFGWVISREITYEIVIYSYKKVGAIAHRVLSPLMENAGP